MNSQVAASLSSIAQSMYYLLPEWLLCMGIISLIFVKKNKWNLPATALLVLVHVAMVAMLLPQQPVFLFNDLLRLDVFSSCLKLLLGISMLFALVMTDRDEEPEFFLLLLTALLGAQWLVMSTHFIVLLLAMELISLPSYVLAGFGRHRLGAEAGWKYFLYGSAATATMLFGMSYLYGLTGALDFSSAEFSAFTNSQPSPLFLIGSLLLLVGFLFKMAAVPLHLWAPDVYKAAPLPVVAFFSVVPKLAGLAVVIKLSLALNMAGHDSRWWLNTVGVIAIASMTAGNLSALWQQDVKRLMAYSSIAQAGFLLAAVAVPSPEAVPTTLFYATVFALGNFAAFFALKVFASQDESYPVASLAGRFRQQPAAGLALLAGMISLTGLPPVAGFMGKVFIFSQLWQAYQASAHAIFLWVFVIGLINTVVALFFYIRLPYVMIFKNYSHEKTARPSVWPATLSVILSIALLALFFMPGQLMSWLNRITFVP
jgi:NADH-quinone oxidoreductase subunit N